MTEVRAAAGAVGVAIGDEFLHDLMALTDNMGRYKRSMLLDHQAGRAMEVEAIVGEALRAGRAAGVDMPATQTIYAMLSSIDRIRAGSRP